MIEPHHPGESIKLELVNRGMTQKQLAKAVRCSQKHLSQVITCQKPLHPKLAVAIETVFENRMAGILMIQQAQYDVFRARQAKNVIDDL